MTREEAIKMVQAHKFPRPMEEWQRLNNEAIDMAIEALSAEYEDYEHATLVDIKEPLVKHDREWIIGCIKHDGFIKTHRFDKANRIILEALSADTVSREEYEELYRKAKEVNGMANDILADFPSYKELVSVVRKPIKGYEDYYEVDQFGRVFAKERIIHVKDHDREYDKHLPSRQMKQSVHTKGYKIVPLTKDGVCTTKFVHRLVAEAFIPNPDDLPFVNHIDEDKTNNFVENLEWCTEQYNSTYGKAREKHAKALKGRHHTEEHKKKISDSLKRFYGERREE